MNKKVILIIVLLGISECNAQDVHYYKLTRIQQNSISNRDVSGGQFITFASNICYESNINGAGVGHGTLTRNNNYSNSQYTTYQGSSYWGSSTTFKFNADKSVLNVVLDNGDIYVYKRATPPAGVTTCSLIRQKSSSSSSGYTPPPTYPVQQYPQQQYPQQQYPQQQAPRQDNPQRQSTPKQKQRLQCFCCKGKGEVIKDDLVTFGLPKKKYCNKCRQTVLEDHYHVPCKCCYGKGYTEY